MVVEIIGARRDISFADSNGKQVAGCKVFWSFPETGVVGKMTEGKFFPVSSPFYASSLSLEPGDMFNVTYGRNNLIDYLELVSSSGD